ncbi:uncharacterized protein LOC132751982 [Ruditapes philippinarum]|uniref:uncharacterized protein LOC132751982 n=1 Tax=Ruditapes philippinarum TaxID=129788 RepID=UPI00295B25AD|nr:uncharacterized protein LOC132751982 [Ruditapes philippinarum]
MKLSHSNKGFTDDKDSLSNDTDLSVDASAVPPRPLPPEVDEERNSNHPEEAEFDNMERCGDGPVNSLGQEREGVQCQRTSIENDSVGTERDVIEPAAPSDNMTAGIVLNRTEENHHLTVWYEMFVFLQCNMRFQDFKIFARRLACNTNKDFFETIDVKIENSGEGNTPPNERIYQILTSWRQATPNAQLNDILDALKHCNLNALCIKLIDKLKDKNLLDADIDGDFLDTVTARSGNDNSLSPGNDLSVQDAVIYIEDNDLAYGGHVVMEDLKSFKYEDDDAGCIS